MSLKQKTVSPALPEPRPETEEARPDRKSVSWLGFALVVIGVVLISLAATDAFATTGDASDTLRGSGSADRLDGRAGDDIINGFAGDDVLSGGEGSDEVYGGPGRDLMFGGAGDDFVEAKDGGTDYIDCGAGDDVASVDGAGDRVSPSCETVYPG